MIPSCRSALRAAVTGSFAVVAAAIVVIPAAATAASSRVVTFHTDDGVNI
ncbi:MAG: hypothetical protein HY655_05510, partial [Acidobacteria bacterium]|nr:hypothetical protein [Acidobacteriota bacterium]